MRVTSDVGVFRRTLQVGDVVAFDSLSQLSALIQFADRAPVNHVGIVVDPTRLVMANLPGHGSDPAIAAHPIHSLLRKPIVRGATALRHPALEDPQRRAKLLEVVADYEAKASRFAVADLPLLAPAAYLRSYVSVPGHPVPHDKGQALFVHAVCRLASALAGAIPGDRQALVCSEFVFRCFDESGIHVSVSHPLRGPGPDEPSVPREVRALLRELVERLRGQPEPEPTNDEALAPTPQVRTNLKVVADFVTPGDLWRSPSFTPVATLVKPPMRTWPPVEQRGSATGSTPAPSQDAPDDRAEGAARRVRR